MGFGFGNMLATAAQAAAGQVGRYRSKPQIDLGHLGRYAGNGQQGQELIGGRGQQQTPAPDGHAGTRDHRLTQASVGQVDRHNEVERCVLLDSCPQYFASLTGGVGVLPRYF